MPDRPTPIFSANDVSAMGVYQAAREFGLRIPEYISVVGIDNLRDAACLNPPLTTIDQSIEKMGTMATELILRLLKGESFPINTAEDSHLYKIPTQLVIRDSCAPVPSA
jgi:DNA-binding LacI/PurR family transcriptional regulator